MEKHDYKEKLSRYKKRSLAGETWRRFKKNKSAVAGLAFLGLLVALTIFANFYYDHDTQVVGMNLAERLQHPSWQHPFGTDDFGRDIMIRILYGAKYSLSIGIVAVMVSLVGGVLWGSIAGYCGGVVEMVLMRINDVFLALPSILMAIAVVTVLGKSAMSLMIAVGVCTISTFAQVTRSSVLTVRNNDFVESARAIGATNLQIIFGQVLPNCLAPIIVQSTLRMGGAIISAASLSYLGMGVPLPEPEWGAMLSAGRNFLKDYSYMTFFPGLVLLLTVIAFNLIGDGLRDAMDPKLKR